MWYLQLKLAENSLKVSCCYGFVVSIQDHAKHCFKDKCTLCFIFPSFCSHKFTVRYFKLTSRNRGALNIKLICIQWVISMLLTVPPMFSLLGRMHQVIALFRNFQRKKWMHFHGFLYLFVLNRKGNEKVATIFFEIWI